MAAEIGGQPFPLTTLSGGINRLKIKGGAQPNSLYDLVNSVVTQTGSCIPRDGLIREADLSASGTIGLMALDGIFQVFATAYTTDLPEGYNCNVLQNPSNTSDTLETIWYAQAFMGFPFVVAEFESGAIVHFWIQNTGTWAANTVYQPGDIILPTTPNGFEYIPTSPYQYTTWAPGVATANNAIVIPSTPNGYFYVAFVPSGETAYTGSTEPVWPTQSGAVVDDFADFTVNSTVTTTGSTTGTPLASSITDKYGDSSAVAGLTQTGTPAPANQTTPNASQAIVTWTKATIYQPGALVIPSTNSGAETNAIPNGDFSQGDVDWTLSGNWEIIFQSSPVTPQSQYELVSPPGSINAYAQMESEALVSAGTSVTLSAYTTAGTTPGAVAISIGFAWYSDTGGTDLISRSDSGATLGNLASSSWKLSSFTATAPAGTQSVKAYVHAASGTSDRDTIGAAGFSWNLATPASVTQFIFEAVQSGPGTSGNTEPVWPDVSGDEVSDNTVTWKAVGTSVIEWTAYPIMLSGSTEPAFPTTLGVTYPGLTVTHASPGVGTVSGYTPTDGDLVSIIVGTGGSIPGGLTADTPYYVVDASGDNFSFAATSTGSAINTTSTGSNLALDLLPTGANGAAVADGTPVQIGGVNVGGNFTWTATCGQISDANDPNTVAVVTGASHVFAGNNDVVDYSAAVNPTDWTSANNAGYLPTGLQQYGSNPVAVLGLYRTNLIVMNSGGYQMWQIDPDPANMDLLDAQPIGSVYTRSAQTIANDMLFLTSLGVRNIGTTGATANMQTGFTGQPVDALIQPQIQAGIYTPISVYYPQRGQYWIMFGDQAFVLTVTGLGQSTWSRYTFPDVITDWTLNGTTLYLRSAGGLVWQLDPNTYMDDVQTVDEAVSISIASPAVVTWDNHGLSDGDIVVFGAQTPGFDSFSFTAGNGSPAVGYGLANGGGLGPVDSFGTLNSGGGVGGTVLQAFYSDYSSLLGESIVTLIISNPTPPGTPPPQDFFTSVTFTDNTDTQYTLLSADAVFNSSTGGGVAQSQWYWEITKGASPGTSFTLGDTYSVTVEPGGGGPGGTIPTPLETGVSYFVSNSTPDTFELLSIPESWGGEPITTTANGSGNPAVVTTGIPFYSLIQWPWLDLGNFGFNKELIGFDAVGTGLAAIQFDYDESNPGVSVTTLYPFYSADTVPGQPIAYPLNAASFSTLLYWFPNQAWEWNAINLYANVYGSTG